MVAERDLDRVRSGHADLASAEEARAYAKYAAINNAYARELGSRIVPEDVRLMTTFATPSAYQDISQQQQVSLREMAIGTSSKLRHTAMMNRTSLANSVPNASSIGCPYVAMKPGSWANMSENVWMTCGNIVINAGASVCPTLMSALAMPSSAAVTLATICGRAEANAFAMAGSFV